MTRIEKVQKFVIDNKLNALLIDNPVDLYYLTNQYLSLGRLVVEPGDATLFVDGRYFEACRQNAPMVVKLLEGHGEKSTLKQWWKFEGKKVGFDANYTSYAEFENLQSLGSSMVGIKTPLKQIREIKDSKEISILKKAAELGSKGFDYICSLLKEGISEKEVAKALEIFWLQEGGEKLAFTPHVAFGEGSSQPHYHVSERRLQKGDLILIDIGVVVDHYHSDMTRVLFYGQPHEDLQHIYGIVHEAFEASVAMCRPGVKIGDIDQAARGLIAKKGYEKYFPHSLGHGVGLDIHESPRIHSIGPDADRVLEAGMVITIEPGIYLPGRGGIRLEDTLVITASGYEDITKRPQPSVLPMLNLL